MGSAQLRPKLENPSLKWWISFLNLGSNIEAEVARN